MARSSNSQRSQNVGMPKAKNPSEASANMTNLFVKIPRLKWPCVLQPLHVQSSTFDKNYLQGS